ncbi:HPr kinase/phosphorylase [Phenylobacterium soli]|uniref:HPr kinase/phosphorylase n=1 Tax=Phenylobacterium soli TaxID=2170551 RepID=A0A328AHV2_9CAUL|nr:HPr kinase/phosphorylase [Phenylobacterium soli]RAK53646.1 HPr kinase/phosphorylase [Phenylobacterium soli]
MSVRHAGLVALRLRGRWAGALIEGPSGSGKSDLALRCLDAGFRLVADDRTLVWRSEGRLFGRAPDSLAGLIEVRGLDVVAEPHLPFCEILLAARCGEPERIPGPQTLDVLGRELPLVVLAARESSAPAKLSRALARFDGGPDRRM